MRLLTLLTLAGLAVANKVQIDDGANAQVCSGIYSKHDWGGSFKPHIDVLLNEFGTEKYNPKSKSYDENREQDVQVSYVIFEYRDLINIGSWTDDGHYKYICDSDAVAQGLCDEKQKNRFLINSNVTNLTIMAGMLTHVGSAHIDYRVNTTGYYCVSTFTITDKKYKGQINFQNAYGELSGSEIPKLPAYGILSICYLISLCLFGFQFFKKRKENQILPLQRYLLAILGFLTFDTIVVWSYYDLVNRTKNPSNGFVIAYMVFLSILNATKIAFLFFLLLCISLGYGVVSLKLKKSTMFKCKILAGFHFAASLIYLISTYYNGDTNTTLSQATLSDNGATSGILGLILMIPITITLTIYYVCIMAAIRATNASLHQQRQIIKLQLYENLLRVIICSVAFTFLGLVLSSFIFLGMSSTLMIESHWKSAYFIFDFWPSVVFFLIFMGIAWLWRPTETSYMLAISQQVSGTADDEFDDGEQQTGYHQGTEFELDDMLLISHDDDETQGRDDDSFELHDNEPSSSKTHPAPPSYDDGESSAPLDESNTLFEVGEHDDEVDSRLGKKD